MITITVPMALERETKNKVVFCADDRSAPVENVYIRKDELPTPLPREVVVTIGYDG